MSIKHSKTSTKVDSADTSLVRPSDWNAGHVIEPGSIVTDDLADASVTAAKLAQHAAVRNLYDQRELRWVDDWEVGEALFATINGNAIPIGSAPHSLYLQGTARLIPVTGSQRPGFVELHTGETADGRARLHTLASGAFDGGAGSMDFMHRDSIVAFGAVSSPAQEFVARVGIVGNAWLLGAATPPLPGFGCFFRYDRLNNGGVHKWEAVCRDLDVETAVVLDGTTQGGIATVDIGTIAPYTLPDGDFWRLWVEIQGVAGAANVARFYASRVGLGSNVLCATITTNMPTHSLASDVDIQKTAGTTGRSIALDYTDYYKRLRQDRTP